MTTNVEIAKHILWSLVGSASVCWDPKPTGVFDSTQANRFVDEAIEQLKAKGILKDIPVHVALDS